MEDHRVELLQSMPLFGGLTAESLRFIMARSYAAVFEAGSWLFQEHDDSDCMYVLEEGKVTIFKQFDGRDYELNQLGMGDCVGEMSLLDLRPRSASVKAITRCRTIHISATTLYEFHKHDLEQFTVLNMNMAREVVRRLRNADNQLFKLWIRLKLLPKDIGMA